MSHVFVSFSCFVGTVGPIGFDVGNIIGHLLMVRYHLFFEMQHFEQAALFLHNLSVPGLLQPTWSWVRQRGLGLGKSV